MKIPIVDNNDNVIGEEEGKVVHEKGLCHREINVYFVTKDKKIIFQKRSLSKKLWPGKLDATAGGHVDSGEDYPEAAIRESEEETGVKIKPEKMRFIKKYFSEIKQPITGLINKKFKTVFAYDFDGDIKDLKIEKEDGDGFVSYSLDELLNLSSEQKELFIPSFITKEYISEIYSKIIK